MWCTPRARRSTATTSTLPMREDALLAAGVAVRRDQAGGRAPVPPLFRQSRRADGLAALFHGLRPAAAAGHGLPPLFHRGPGRAAGRAVRRRAADPRLHLRGRRGHGHGRGGRPRDAGGVYNIGGGSRVVAARGVRHDWPRVRPAGTDRPSTGAEGRHARHLRGYVASAGRSRVSARRSTSKRGLREMFGWMEAIRK